MSCPSHDHSVDIFQAATEVEILNVIPKSATKSSNLDPIPTDILKRHAYLLVGLPVITRLVNASLSSGVVPTVFKQELVTPLLKKASLDPSILKGTPWEETFSMLAILKIYLYKAI